MILCIRNVGKIMFYSVREIKVSSSHFKSNHLFVYNGWNFTNIILCANCAAFFFIPLLFYELV